MQTTIAYIKESLKAYYPENEISGFMRIIIEHLTAKPYIKAVMESAPLSQKQKDEMETILEQLKAYTPIQYITGNTEFFGMPFLVDKNTLIPRPETEELVELVLNDNPQPHLSVLDIGTGSGCIAIALARHMNKAQVSAWDFSAGALDTAKCNAIANNLPVDFALVNVLDNYPIDKKFDIIVSNPPYIMECEKQGMERNVLDYEPHSALFVPDNQALLFYERIADIAIQLLKKGGRLYFEINQKKGREMTGMLRAKGFSDIELIKDLSNNDRMTRACL